MMEEVCPFCKGEISKCFVETKTDFEHDIDVYVCKCEECGKMFEMHEVMPFVDRYFVDKDGNEIKEE